MADIKEVFKSKVTERLSLHPNQWAGEDSAEVVRSVVTSLTDDQGNPIKLTPEEDDVVQLASRPTNNLQVDVIRTIVERHKATFDKTTEGLIRRVVGAPAFKIELAKAGFIKEASAGGLKDLLG
jgi:purine nucleoside permease